MDLESSPRRTVRCAPDRKEPATSGTKHGPGTLVVAEAWAPGQAAHQDRRGEGWRDVTSPSQAVIIRNLVERLSDSEWKVT